MRDKKSIQSLTLALCAGIVLLSTPSCDNNNNSINEEFEVVKPANPIGNPNIEEVDSPTAILGNLGTAEVDLRNCFTNIVDPQNAKVIIVESGSVEEYEEFISEAYNNGVLIVVFNPDSSVLSGWSENNNIFYAGSDENEKCAIYGFNNRGTSYSYHDIDDIDDYEVPLFHLCSWVNSVSGSRLKGVDLRTKEIKKRFLPQSVTHTFKILLDEQQLIDGHWTAPDQLSLSTTANVTYDIYPIHVFDDNAPGDYYAVEAEITLHNTPMNNGSWARRRGNELTQLCGFYLNRCDISANLFRKANGSFVESASNLFAEGTRPHPASYADAAAYDPGFEWSLDATVSGGVPDSKDNYRLTSFNNWIWNNSSTIALPGIEIKNNANAADVGYSLVVNGLPGSTDDLAVTPIPDLATGDLSFKYSWIWRVGDIGEASKECLYMQVGVKPVYQAYQWINGGKMTVGEFENAVPESTSTFKIPLTPPNRVATGSAVIRNSSEGSYYIDNIKFWRNKTTDNEPDFILPQTISTSTATGGSGVSATMLILPAGDYIVKGVRYSMENDERVDEQVIVNTQPITLSVAGNVTIDFGSDVFTIM